MALKEYKPEKLLYTMGEVTEMFDVNPSLIRFWVDRFDILKPKKNKKGNRLFTPADVKNLETIYHLTKERGMKLAGVEKYLKNNREEAERETEIVRRLQTIRALLTEIREELKDDVEGETRVFEAVPAQDSESIAGDMPEPEIPNPLEFTEEVLPGEIVEDEPEADDFWSDEPPVEEPEAAEEPEAVEQTPAPEEPASAFDGFSEETDSFDLQTETDELYGEYPIVPDAVEDDEEAPDWQEDEEDIPDEEVSVPFTSQPLFELEETPEISTDEAADEAAEDEESKPSAVDTQQSLF